MKKDQCPFLPGRRFSTPHSALCIPHFVMPKVFPVAIVFVLSVALATGVCAADPANKANATPTYPDVPNRVETSGLKFITPSTQRAINRGLEFLARNQLKDGSFGSGRDFKHNVAVTALSGMAFLSAGHTPGRGKYGGQVEQAATFLLKNTDPSGFIKMRGGESHCPMYEHGFATLFLAEVYGMTGRKDIREKLSLAVNLIVQTQNDEGGWRYFPVKRDADISVTVCQIMALRAARNSGIFVPKDTVDRCIKYVKACQKKDGAFQYQLGHGRDSRFPRSAAGVVALYSAGEYKSPEIKKGIAFLMRFLPSRNRLRPSDYYFYGHYYGVQAMWHAGGDAWRLWYPAIRDELLLRQEPNGSWENRLQNPEYGTAMALLVLQMPNNYLPIFQR